MRYIQIVEDKSPALYPAIKVNGKVFAAKTPGATHFTALDLIPDPVVRRRETMDANNRGFVNERGRWLSRDKAARYARDFDLYDDTSPQWSEWMRTSFELSSETPLKV